MQGTRRAVSGDSMQYYTHSPGLGLVDLGQGYGAVQLRTNSDELARLCHGTDEVAMTIAPAAPPPPDCSTPFLSLDEVAHRRHPHGRAVRRRHAVSDTHTRTDAAQHVAG